MLPCDSPLLGHQGCGVPASAAGRIWDTSAQWSEGLGAPPHVPIRSLGLSCRVLLVARCKAWCREAGCEPHASTLLLRRVPGPVIEAVLAREEAEDAAAEAAMETDEEDDGAPWPAVILCRSDAVQEWGRCHTRLAHSGVSSVKNSSDWSA